MEPKAIQNMSYAAKSLLCLIVEHTERKSDGSISRFWVPQADPQFIHLTNDTYRARGAGDAQALRGLENKRLIKAVKGGSYWYAATEDGLLAYEVLRAECG